MSYFVLLNRRILIGNFFFEFFDFLNFASYFVVDSLDDYWLYGGHLVLTQKSTLEKLSGATGVFRFKFFTRHTSSCISNPNFLLVLPQNCCFEDYWLDCKHPMFILKLLEQTVCAV